MDGEIVVVYEINKKKYVLMNMTCFDVRTKDLNDMAEDIDAANDLGAILRKIKYQIFGIIFTTLTIDFEFLVPETKIERFAKIVAEGYDSTIS